MVHTASFVEEVDIDILYENGDTVVFVSESDISDVREAIGESESKDPFQIVKGNKLPRKFQQKVNRLEKKLEGEGGAKSKYVDPELVTGYSLFNVVVSALPTAT